MERQIKIRKKVILYVSLMITNYVLLILNKIYSNINYFVLLGYLNFFFEILLFRIIALNGTLI